MANHGKRMVKENLIAEIGQGGGTEYTAGANITIEDGVISAVDTTYTAGTGIDITEDVISVDNTIALKSDIIDVAANTAFTPSATLTNLQVGTVTYEVPQGGGSSINNVTVEDTYEHEDPEDPTSPEVLTEREIVVNDGTNEVFEISSDFSNFHSQDDMFEVIQYDTNSGDPNNKKRIGVTKELLGMYINQTVYPYSGPYNGVTQGPMLLDTDYVNNWLKILPVVVSRNTSGWSTLRNAGFTGPIVSYSDVRQDETIKIQGYFLMTVENGSSPYAITGLRLFTPENRTGSNTIVNRTSNNYTELTKTAGDKWVFNKMRYRGTNDTFLTLQGNDPLGNPLASLPIYSFSAADGTDTCVSTNATNAFPYRTTFSIGIDAPTAGKDYMTEAKAPTVDGDYHLNVSVSSGVPTFSWATPTTDTTVYAHTANFVLEDGSSGDSYTVTMQFNYGTQTGLDAVGFEDLFDSVTGEFYYPYTAYFTDGVTSTLYQCRLTFGGTLFVIEPFANADYQTNIIDLTLDTIGFSDVGIGY